MTLSTKIQELEQELQALRDMEDLVMRLSGLKFTYEQAVLLKAEINARTVTKAGMARRKAGPRVHAEVPDARVVFAQLRS